MPHPSYHWRTERIAMLAVVWALSATLAARADQTFDPMS